MAENSHNKALNNFCRLCGEINKTSRKNAKNKSYHKPDLCSKFSDEIFLLWRVDIYQDNEETHSKIICFKCKNKISHSKRIKDDIEKYISLK